MAILFWESFDHYNTSQLMAKWNSQIGLYAPWLPAEITASAGRKGNGLALQTGGLVYKSFADSATVAVGFSFRATAISSRRICSFRDEESIQVYLHLSATGFLQVFRGNGTLLGSSAQPIVANKWYYIELKSVTNSTAGAITLRVNGKLNIGLSASPVNTQTSSFARVNILSLGDPTNNPTVFHYDDVWISNSELLGPQSVDVLRPNGGVPGYMNMEVVGGAGSHYQAIKDQTPDGDTSYVYAPTTSPGSVFFSEFENIREGSGAISAVAVHTYARKEYGNTRGFRTGMFPGTHDGAPGSLQYYADPMYVETEYAYHSDYYEKNPGTGGTWTVGSVNALKAGFLGYVS